MSLVEHDERVDAAINRCFFVNGASASDDEQEAAVQNLVALTDRMVDEMQRRFASGEFTREELAAVVAESGRMAAWGMLDGHTPEIGESNYLRCLEKLLRGEAYEWDIPVQDISVARAPFSPAFLAVSDR